MDERQLRAMHRAAQPILQRTAPTQAASGVTLTPAVLDRVAWNVVLAYLANVAERPPAGLPRQAKSGEPPLADDEVRAAVERLRAAQASPRLQPKAGALDGFRTAAGRLLQAYGWAPQRATQAADEMAVALQALHG